MFSTKAVITTAGLALINAASASNKITITRIDVGSGVANPAAGTEYTSPVGSTSISNVKYSATADNVFVGTGLNKSRVGVRAKVSKGAGSFWAAQLGLYSNTTLVAILIIPAVQINAANADVFLRGTFLADHTKFNLTVGAYTKLASKTKKTQVFNNLSTALAQRMPAATEGATYFGTGSATDNAARRLVVVAPIAMNQGEVDWEKTRGSGADIFENWQRFSHNNTWTQPANASELNAWEYVSAQDAIRCTLNTATYVGFVSQRKYDKYELDVNLWASGDNDDDDIGIVMAYYVDPADGKEHTLSAIRSPGGTGFSFAIVKDYKLPSMQFLHRSAVIAYGNGNYGETAAAAGYTANTAGQNWQTKGKTRLKVTRNGSVFSAVTSEFGSSWETLKQSSLFTFDVSAIPGLEMFKAKCQYGYSAHSQFSATYYVRSFVDEGSVIVDIAGLKTWAKNNGVWEATSYPDAASFSQALGVGRMYHNSILGKTYFVFPDAVRRIF